MLQSEDDTFRMLCKASVKEICEIYDDWIIELDSNVYDLATRIQKRGWSIEEGQALIKHYDLPRD